MSRNTHALAVVFLCGLLMGCVPLPRKTVARYGVEGRLTDAATGEPIAKSRVFVLVDSQEFNKRTNRRGEFRVAPQMHHFWTWLGGPWWPDATRATVDITFDNYAPYHRTFIVRSEAPDVPVPPDHDQLKGVYITLGDVEMRGREQGGAANRGQPVGSQTNRTSAAAGPGG
jgi:hypothetical protein